MSMQSGPPPEPQLPSYVAVARFSSRAAAGRVYQQARDVLFASPAGDLSAYRVRRVMNDVIPASGRRGKGGFAPGSTGLPRGESQRGPEHAGKAGSTEGVYGEPAPARPA
jgi:hypothetical protein